jgi:DNA-binding response OmpR family regulator
VLVADDAPTIRVLLRTALERHGHTVLEAQSAVEIFTTLDTSRPDVLLLDVCLGADDGLAIGAGLRGERRHESMKIVFMTGTPDRPGLLQLSRSWDVPILVKPFNLDEVLSAIS